MWGTSMHKRLVVAAAVVLAAANGTSAWANWGCAYDSSAGVGRMWNVPSEEEARDVTIEACNSHKFARCHIIGCSDNVNSKEDADEHWPRTPGIKYELCGREGQPKCGS